MTLFEMSRVIKIHQGHHETAGWKGDNVIVELEQVLSFVYTVQYYAVRL